MKKQVIELYGKAKSYDYIKKELGIGKTAVQSILKENGIHIRTRVETLALQKNLKFLSELESRVSLEDLKGEYDDGALISELMERYDISRPRMDMIFKAQNWTKRSDKETQDIRSMKREMNHSFFSSPLSDNAAWLLGMLATDGTLVKEGNGVSLGLQLGDKEVLEKIKRELRVSNKITETSSNLNGKEYYSAKLYFASPQIRKDLELWGLTPNKSLTLQMPKIKDMSKDTFFHFLRGLIDGDGSIAKSPSYKISLFSGSPQFLAPIMQKLLSYGFETSLLSSLTNRKNVLYTMNVLGDKAKKEELFNLLYPRCLNENDLFLERKRKIAHNL